MTGGKIALISHKQLSGIAYFKIGFIVLGVKFVDSKIIKGKNLIILSIKISKI